LLSTAIEPELIIYIQITAKVPQEIAKVARYKSQQWTKHHVSEVKLDGFWFPVKDFFSDGDYGEKHRQIVSGTFLACGYTAVIIYDV
jgi:hypothetical protein